MSAYFMGLDNGGTAVKCVIFDDRGCEIAEASVKTPVLSPVSTLRNGIWGSCGRQMSQ